LAERVRYASGGNRRDAADDTAAPAVDAEPLARQRTPSAPGVTAPGARPGQLPTAEQAAGAAKYRQWSSGKAQSAGFAKYTGNVAKATVAAGGWAPGSGNAKLDAVMKFATRSQKAGGGLGGWYLFGGNGAGGRYDCSAFVQAAFRRAGISLPRVSRDQFRTGRPVRGPLKPGDLLFWSGTWRGGVSHVAIYLGNGKAAEYRRSGTRGAITNITSRLKASNFAGARRVL
jgi:cell wall-associated NlpC family hydrolase